MNEIKSSLKKDFSTIPNALINDDQLDPMSRFLFTYMASKSDDWQFFHKQLQKALQIKDPRTFRKYMAELLAAGWVSRERMRKDGSKFDSFSYTLHCQPVCKNPIVQILHSAKNAHLTNKEPLTNEGIKENVQIENLHAPSSFDVFWKVFGYNKSKKKAASAFSRLTKEKERLCVDRVPEYKAFIAATGTPQMHPTTWINGERWNDDFTIPAGGKKVVNTADALHNKTDMSADESIRYAGYLKLMNETYPALLASECRVLAASEWLNYKDPAHLTPAQRIHMTVQNAASLRAAVHDKLNQNKWEREKWGSVNDAIIAAYRAACAGETSGGI